MAETFRIESSAQKVEFDDGDQYTLREFTGEQISRFNADLQLIGELPPEVGRDAFEDAAAQPAPEADYQATKRDVIEKWGALILQSPVATAKKVRKLENGEFHSLVRQQLICNNYWLQLGERRRFASSRMASETQTAPSP